MSIKYGFIRGEEGNYTVENMCRWAKVSRSGYYEWRDRGTSPTGARRRTLQALVAHSFAASDSTYGYRRVHADLARRGHHADPDTIRQVMRSLGLIACQPRPWRPTTTVAGDASTLPDLVRRDFTCDTPATKLVGDITYIRTWQGWLYLATVLDCCTKKVVGYAMADHMRTTLISDAARPPVSRSAPLKALSSPASVRNQPPRPSANTVQLRLHGCSLVACLVVDGASLSRIVGCRTWSRSVC